MQDQEFSMMGSLKEIQGNTQAVKAVGKGVFALGQGIISLFRLITASAGAWVLCLMRWRVGTAVALWRYPLAYFILSTACGAYQDTRWQAPLFIFQNIVFLSVACQAIIAIVRFFRGSKRPIHSQDLGSAHALLAPLWLTVFGRTKSPALWMNLVGEPAVILLLAVVVFAIEQTVLPAPRDLWAISGVLVLVALCMVCDAALILAKTRLQIMQITDRELEQQSMADTMAGERSASQEREAEGLAQIPANEARDTVSTQVLRW
ncbi:MAG: hypothetical protein NCW75_04215 [Phycisphaera sp.]|nr:MAG: hypothetical protein NCW75_04215 [Phycisphaera sp.]